MSQNRRKAMREHLSQLPKKPGYWKNSARKNRAKKDWGRPLFFYNQELVGEKAAAAVSH